MLNTIKNATLKIILIAAALFCIFAEVLAQAMGFSLYSVGKYLPAGYFLIGLLALLLMAAPNIPQLSRQ